MDNDRTRRPNLPTCNWPESVVRGFSNEKKNCATNGEREFLHTNLRGSLVRKHLTDIRNLNKQRHSKNNHNMLISY